MDTPIPAGVMAARLPWVTPMLNSRAALAGSAATTGVTVPNTFTTPERIPATVLTCGSAARDRSRAGLRPLEPPACVPLPTTKSARSAELMVESAEALTDDAMIVVIDTSATPTISAAAVAEVRDGLRMALRCPSVPVVRCAPAGRRARGRPGGRRTG